MTDSKLTIPPMPEVWALRVGSSVKTTEDSIHALQDYARTGWQTAQREVALADELAEALESLESLFDKIEKGFDYPAEVRFAARDAAKAAIQSHKEARNG